MMNAFEITASNSEFPYLVIASSMTKAIGIFCSITEQTESVLKSVKELPYSCDKVMTQDMVEKI